MAEQDGQERTEQPTDKRLREAREKGQVARSRELGTTLMLLSGAGAMLVFGGHITGGLAQVMYQSFTFERDQLADTQFPLNLFMHSVALMLIKLTPLFAVFVVAAVAGAIALSGWNFSTQALEPKLSKIDPIKGMKKVFGPQSLMELAKALAKFALLVGAGIVVLWWLSDRLLTLGRQPVEQAVIDSLWIIMWTFFFVSLTTTVVALVDVPFQKWNHVRQLRMTRQEVRQEHKDTDGSPELKQRIRRTQQEMAFKRMMEEVPKADVIITNPTHFSVAVRYEHGATRAPKVVAKGADFVAFEIRRVAQEHDVPLLRAPSLARAIYFTTDLDKEIPEGLYTAVAQVLAYVYQLRDPKRRSPVPLKVNNLPIPDELRHDD